MKNLGVGVHVAGTNVPKLIDGIVAAEKAGIQCAWMTCGGVAPDPLAVFAAAAGRTTRILLGTSIVPTFPRHPLALVQSALVVDALAPGRLAPRRRSEPQAGDRGHLGHPVRAAAGASP